MRQKTDSGENEQETAQHGVLANTAVLTGIIALLTTLIGVVVKGIYDSSLERQKFQSELVLRAMQSPSAAERTATLDFLVKARLITDEEIERGLASIVASGKRDTTAVPRIAPVGVVFPAPMVQNARVFLLTGVQRNVPVLDSLRQQLAMAGYGVLGTRTIANDDSRPSVPEVTFFNPSDSAQAAVIATFLRSRLADPRISPKRRDDADAGAGYIEIWLGKQ